MQIKCLEWCLAHIERPVGGGGKIIHSLTSISHQFTELLRHARSDLGMDRQQGTVCSRQDLSPLVASGRCMCKQVIAKYSGCGQRSLSTVSLEDNLVASILLLNAHTFGFSKSTARDCHHRETHQIVQRQMQCIYCSTVHNRQKLGMAQMSIVSCVKNEDIYIC